MGQIRSTPVIISKTFTKVDIEVDVKEIACGYYHTILLINDGSPKGTIMGCGMNTSYQLGINDTGNHHKFTPIPK